MTDFKIVPLVEIKPDPNQPRKYYDEVAMQELTNSVKEKGILQPLLLRPIGSSETYLLIDPAAKMDISIRRASGYNGPAYLIVCGERRYRASNTAGLVDIPAVIRDLNDEEALELQIIENLQRKDVHPMEEAVAFKSLADKGKDLKEIAARIGKSIFYARQRIKLCELIQEWQQAYYANRISSKIALTLCTFDEKMQKEMWKEKGNGREEIDIDNWYINRFRGDLKKATFSLDDNTLDKKAGACSSCKFNSAVASLFPEAADSPTCSYNKCFLHKTDIHFEREIKKAKEDPAIVFVNNEYWHTEDNLVRKLQKEGVTILNGRSQGNFEVIASPEPPSIDDFDLEDYKNEQERKQAYLDELKDYEKELKEYENKVAGGKYKKAFCFHGSDKGKYVYIEIRKGASSKSGSSKTAKEKEAAGKLTAQDVADEIKRIQDREKRNKELDLNKVHKAILDSLDKKKVAARTLPWQGVVDRGIMVYILLHKATGYGGRDRIEKYLKGLPKEPGYGKVGYAFNYFEKLGAITDDQLAVIVRSIAFDEWGSVNFQNDVHDGDTTVRLISQYAGINIAEIEAEQAEVAVKRQERVEKRIVELQAKKKELSASKKSTQKIGKVVSELVDKPSKKATKKTAE